MESSTANLAKTNQAKNQKFLKKAQAKMQNPPRKWGKDVKNIQVAKEYNTSIEKITRLQQNRKGKKVQNIKEASAEHMKKLVAEFVTRIKTAEDIAEMKEMEIERKFGEEFVEEIQEQITKMHMLMQKFKEVDIEKLNEEYDMKQIEAKKRIVENLEAKKMGILLEEEMDAKQMKRKMKKMEAKKRRAVRKEVEKEIMKKIKKMIESEYREMMVVEVREKIKEAHGIIKKVKEPKNMETIKEAEIIKEIKNTIEAEFLERMVVEINMRKEAAVLYNEMIKDSEEGENTSTMVAGSTSRTKHSKMDTVRREAWKLFNASIKQCDFGNIKSEALIFSCTKKGWGDFACHNVLTVWPKLRKMGTKLKGPKDVGKEIIRYLPQSDMIEGTPSLHSVGFVTFKISGKWMAKRIHRMLIEGIDTWAPKTLLKRAIVDFPSLDIGDNMHMDMLRRRYIGRSLTRMLQYCQVHVLNNPHEASHMQIARNVVKTRVIGGTMEIRYNDGNERKLLVSNSGVSDQGLGNASKDLGALRYGAEKLKAEWLLYVTPVAKQKYIEMCFSAAKDAKWLEPAYATYVGYRSCTTKLSKLVYMLNEGKALHKVTAFVLRGNAANYSARDVLECAIQYMFLKTPRMADCFFNLDEILDEEGDTFLYLLNTHARIRSVTNTSRKDIRELKNQASRLILEKDDLLEKGEERELGFHILDLTEVLRSCCFAALPHILCKYLYNLAEIFNRYFVSTFALGWRTRCFLLLCEATSVVMEKCFHLLEITPQCFKSELGVTRLIYGAELSVERPINVGSNPPKCQNTRFEPFSVQLRVDRKFEWDSGRGVVKVFGHVDVADTYGLRSDGWTLTYLPDDLNVELFRRSWSDPINIVNGGYLSFGDPSCSRSVPFSSVMEIEMDIVAMKEEEDDFYPICSCRYDLDHSKFLNGELDGWCGSSAVEGKGGQARINYILLRDAVDATIEITFNTRLEYLKVHGDIVAWYDSGFLFDRDPVEKSSYTASLFELDDSSILKSGPIKLQKSRIAVPRKGSLKIKAHLIEVNSGRMILDTSCVFQSLTDATSEECLEGTDCYFQVKVNWSYCHDDV